jgi:hypothetical protein
MQIQPDTCDRKGRFRSTEFQAGSTNFLKARGLLFYENGPND